ncbi:MAG: hypothetical protein II622_05865, partial [Thermoguttaceae bacterium]|nr:hypothetical protein [Thermoguttaceae bacterium]
LARYYKFDKVSHAASLLRGEIKYTTDTKDQRKILRPFLVFFNSRKTFLQVGWGADNHAFPPGTSHKIFNVDASFQRR